MTLHVVGSFPLGGINLAAEGAVTLTAPLVAQLDSLLFSPFGLSGTQSDVSAQLSGVLQSQVQLGLSISNPIAQIQQTLDGIAGIAASLQAALASPLPSASLSASLSASASVSAALAAKLGGVQGLISAAINAKSPVVDFIADLSAHLAAGPVVAASWGFADSPSTLAQTGADINAAFSSGVDGLLPTDTVFGVLLVTKDVSASVALASTIKVT